MARVLVTFAPALVSFGGTSYTPRACGRERPDGMWEGWIEFVPDGTTPVVRSPRETTQPNLVDLEYWATGLTPVYLEGALARALAPIRRRRVVAVTEAPAYDAPAPTSLPADAEARETPRSEPVVDPFALFAEGDDVLRQTMLALDRADLCAIVRRHELDGGLGADLDRLTDAELIAYIIAAVRLRMVA